MYIHICVHYDIVNGEKCACKCAFNKTTIILFSYRNNAFHKIFFWFCRHTPLISIPVPPLSSPSHSLSSSSLHLKLLLHQLSLRADRDVRAPALSRRVREIVQCLGRLTRSAHWVACGEEDREKQEEILVSVLAVLERSEELLVAAKTVVDSLEVSTCVYFSLLYSGVHIVCSNTKVHSHSVDHFSSLAAPRIYVYCHCSAILLMYIYKCKYSTPYG